MEERLSDLKEELVLKDNEIEKLTTMLNDVSSRVDKSEKSTEINSHRIG